MKEKVTSRVLGHMVLTFLTLVCVVPLLLVLMNSFKEYTDILRNPLAPSFSAGFSNYVTAWKAANFSVAIPNSIVYTGSTILVTLVLSTLAAYAMSGKIKRSGVFLLYFMTSMTVPVQLFLVPLYSFYAGHGWLGNHFMVSLILSACSLPLAISLMRTFFLNIPKELEEAARIDGAGNANVFMRIVLPIVSPGLVTVAIIVGLNSWNEYLVSRTFLQGKQNFTATLALNSMTGARNTEVGILLAATMILVVPVIIFFVIMQKRFIDGIVSGSVKG